jgi:hypothetical protein
MKWLVSTVVIVAAALLSCAIQRPPKTAESIRAAAIRFAQSRGLPPCPTDGRAVDPESTCYDNQGMTWSGCAWTTCGANPECQVSMNAQNKSCGPMDDVPDCEP